MDAIVERIEVALARLAGVLVMIMVVAICADVALRTIFRGGIAWASSVAEYSLYAVTFLAAPLLLRKGQHIRVDMLLRTLPSKAAWLLEWVVDATGAAISAAFAVSAVRVLVQSYSQGSLVIREVIFPEWWLYVPMPVALGLLAAEFLLRMRRLATGERRMRDEATSAA